MKKIIPNLKLLRILLLGSFLTLAFQSCDNEPVDPIVIIDTDSDGVEDTQDNCPLNSNPDQADDDNDGIGNSCDNDGDNDGVADDNDNCPLVSNPDQSDEDNDGIGNSCDEDYTSPFEPLAYCENGFADIYPCQGYDLMSHIPLSVFNTQSGSDIWGWVDIETGKEYAIMGVFNGTVFVDVSDPTNPIFLGGLSTQTFGNIWRDIKIYENYAFIVADNAGDHGMQIFDLKHLRDVANPPQSFTPDLHYSGFGSAHNIFVNENSGYAYVVGTDRNGPYQGNTIIIDIENPLNPIEASVLNGYSHDVQVVIYNGPDIEHFGKEIYLGSNENEIVIFDVTNKANLIELSRISYSNVGYTHQGWVSEDMNYFILGDELDEINYGNNTRTLIFDLSDLDNPIYFFDYIGPTTAIDHNGYVKGNTYYQASYTAGVRMIDITDIENSNISEIDFFDTYPENDVANFDGAWSVYPYLPSGNILVSDINRGLFVIRASDL